MNTKLQPAKTIKTTTHEVTANFTNGFAQHVIELDNGTVLYISYGGDQVTIEERELLEDPATQVPTIINQIEEEA